VVDRPAHRHLKSFLRHGESPSLRLPALFLPLALALALVVSHAGGCSRNAPGPDQKHPPLLPPDYEEEAAAAQILITWRDIPSRPAGVTRERWQAEDLIRRISLLAHEGGADFQELARQYSEDSTTAARGGRLGVFHRGEMVLPFEVAVFNLKVGQISGVVETEYGFHLIKRLPIVRTYAAHLLVAWRGATGATGGVSRTRAQAAALAAELRRQASEPGADLCELVRRYSDDASNRTNCGELGPVQNGMLPLPIEEALFRLEPGEVSDVVETEYGFHIVWRPQ
jgi:hypothetical protein